MNGNAMKTINIKTNIPIKNITPPIYGVRIGIKMSVNDILKCLCKRATIDEVLSDGSTVRLNTKNFRDDFEAELKNKAKEAKKQAEVSRMMETPAFIADMIEEDNDKDNIIEPEEPANDVENPGDNADTTEDPIDPAEKEHPEDDVESEEIVEDSIDSASSQKNSSKKKSKKKK